MNGGDIKKAVINKGKQMASVASAAANGNGSKKRRKGTDLKPIVTNENIAAATDSASGQGYVLFYFLFLFLLLFFFFFTLDRSARFY